MTDLILDILNNGKRLDKRGLLDYRKIEIESGISPKSADGSARVKIGDTEVVAGVKLEIGEPFPDTPDEGSLMVNVELLPLASPEFESGPPNIDAIELSRVIDRGIRESGSIDVEKLCIEPGKKIWMVFIDIYPINDDGNLFDAAALAALVALKDARFPKYDKKTEKIDYSAERTKTPLPLTRTPLSCTLGVIGKNIIVDPTAAEEDAIESRLTVVALEDGTICAMQKGGRSCVNVETIENIIDIAISKGNEIRRLIK